MPKDDAMSHQKCIYGFSGLAKHFATLLHLEVVASNCTRDANLCLCVLYTQFTLQFVGLCGKVEERSRGDK